MKLLIQSAMIFFGTLMAAAVVALGEPSSYVAVDHGRDRARVSGHAMAATLAAAEAAMATAAAGR
jgi:hypothetical protein